MINIDLTKENGLNIEFIGQVIGADGTLLDYLNKGYIYAGTATPSTTPMGITAEDKVFYIAVEEGDYTGFGQLGITELTILKSDGGKWVKEGLGISLDIDEKLTDLESEVKLQSNIIDATQLGELIKGYAIDRNGTIVANSAYAYMRLQVNKGDMVYLKASVHVTISAISQYDVMADKYTPLVTGLSGATHSYANYVYFANQDMTIAFSFAVEQGFPPKILVSQNGSFNGLLMAAISENKTAISENKTAISENKTAISENKTAISENKTAISAQSNFIVPNVDKTDGQIITLAGNVSTAYPAYSLFKFDVPANSIVVFDGVSYRGIMAAIAEYDAEKDIYIPLVSARGEGFDALRYFYVANRDMTIVISARGGSYSPIIRVSQPDSVNAELLKLISENKITSEDLQKKIAYKFSDNGEDLYMATIEDESTEIVYWFKKCMANNLYTFYRVGYRENLTGVPSAENITDANIIRINATSSDNIGPINVSYDGGGSWIGGNHHYPNESAEKKYKSASNVCYYIYADGILLNAGNSGYADSMIVKVHNILYDPSVAPSENTDILSIKMADEYVTYSIKGNTIEVGVSINFVQTTPCMINLYYGMQSMFYNEEFFITPNGVYTNWTDANEVSTTEFNKKDYPDFNRFVEKSVSNKAYQSTYIHNWALGSHRFISDNAFIFNRSYSKCYHHLLGYNSIALAGQCVQWHGSYTFFHNAIEDDDNILSYSGYIGGRRAIFINSKKAYKGFVAIPFLDGLSNVQTLENTGFVDELGESDLQIGGNGVYLSCENPASLILLVK